MINTWAILFSMILSVVLGFIWYGPLFGKKWMALSGIKMPDQKPSAGEMLKPIVISLVGALLMSYTLSYFIAFRSGFYQVSGGSAAMLTALFLWAGLIVPIYFNFIGWEGKAKTLAAIHAGYWLVFLLISSAIISAFM